MVFWGIGSIFNAYEGFSFFNKGRLSFKSPFCYLYGTEVCTYYAIISAYYWVSFNCWASAFFYCKHYFATIVTSIIN